MVSNPSQKKKKKATVSAVRPVDSFISILDGILFHVLLVSRMLILHIAIFFSVVDIPVENAIQQVYDVDTKCWTNKPIQVKLDIEPFASGMSLHLLVLLLRAYCLVTGSLRRAHYLRILSEPNEIYVAKISIDPNEDKDTYYQDVETQMYSKKVRYARIHSVALITSLVRASI